MKGTQLHSNEHLVKKITQEDVGHKKTQEIELETISTVYYVKYDFKSALTSCKSMPGANCGSDHVPVVGTSKIKLKNG